MKDTLLIFDMDNTILRSRIDFARMKQKVYAMLDEYGLPQYKHDTVACSIQLYMESPECEPARAAAMWQAVADIERAGMEGAVLEDNAARALAFLQDYAELAVLTNNTDQNLDYHLGRLGILPYLSCVAGRDTTGSLKPDPGGILYVMQQYPDISSQRTLMIGDAWNDAAAAEKAGIGFVSYNNSRAEDWEKWGIDPLARLTGWTEADCKALLQAVER